MSFSSPFAQAIWEQKYRMGSETWAQTAHRVAKNVLSALPNITPELIQEAANIIEEKKFLPGGRYLYAAGRSLHQVNNCLLLRADDSREGWSQLMYRAGMALMTGAGIGVDYSDIREFGAPISRTGGVASGPLSLMTIINEIGRNVMQGGSRRSAIWAGLSWKHPDVMQFIHYKNWPKEIRDLKAKDFNFPARLDMTNVSVILDDDFFAAYTTKANPKHAMARKVYWEALNHMVTTAEPGFSVNLGSDSGETLRNACTEVCSADDSDICNLGSINLSRIASIQEMERVTELASLFLLAGTIYSHVPYKKVDEIRTKNRRLGLGVMGVHEWLLQRGQRYCQDAELGQWLAVYARSTEYAHRYADYYSISRPVKTRAIAPTGTIGIIAETTTGIEPIFCVAYKRRYLMGGSDWKYQYVVDPTAKRLIDSGIAPESIEDAYQLSFDLKRRVEFQGWVQKYVDHGISSTINLPKPLEGTDATSFGNMLYENLPTIRGVTCYPDNARGGQPLVPVKYSEAVGKDGLVLQENENTCVGGVCGI